MTFRYDSMSLFTSRRIRIGLVVWAVVASLVAASCADESPAGSSPSVAGSSPTGYESLPGRPIDVSPQVAKVLSNYAPLGSADLRVLGVLPIPEGFAAIYTAPDVEPDQVDLSVAVFGREGGKWFSKDSAVAPIDRAWDSPTASPSVWLAAAPNGYYAVGGIVDPRTTEVIIDKASQSDVTVDAHDGAFLAVSPSPRPIQIRLMSGSTLIGATSPPVSNDDEVPSMTDPPEVSSSDAASILNEIRAGEGAKYFPGRLGGAGVATALADLLEAYPDTESISGAATIHLARLSDGENKADIVIQIGNTSDGPVVLGYSFWPAAT